VTNTSKNVRLRKPQLTASAHAEGILRGDRILLSQAITLVESTHPQHRELADEIIGICLPHSGRSLRIGITGSPGVGKSTFIEALGTYLTEKGKKLAVLAVDPSSQVSRGSILGDKTRMGSLSANSRAYVRPSPAGEALGGVASRTRETMLLCEAAGFDTIFIETVGVGQSETAVQGMVDFFLLLLLPGAGDELQGIKRGIVEMAGLIAVNKADGEYAEMASLTKREYARALHLLPPKQSGWSPVATTCSALAKTGMEEIWQFITDFEELTKGNGWFLSNRKQQLKSWLHALVVERLKDGFYTHPSIRKMLPGIEKAVEAGKLSAHSAATDLMLLFLKGKEK
jgi:GTPase